MDEQLTFEFEQRPTIKGFPELRWTGKRPYRSTQYYPAQLRETYGTEKNGWINKIFWGDNLQVMSHLLKEYRGKIDLIYIDPPFASESGLGNSFKPVFPLFFVSLFYLFLHTPEKNLHKFFKNY